LSVPLSVFSTSGYDIDKVGVTKGQCCK